MDSLLSLSSLVAEASPPPAGARLLVAVSGGADSTALLHVLVAMAGERGWRLTAAHLDHGLRGSAGAADRRFVEKLGERLGVAVVTERRPVEPPPAASVEEAAREVRRAFLLEAAARAGAESIALGHNADDLAETVLLRLVRGTGPGGLAAMTPRDGPWWRPLLAASRESIREALGKAGLAWREDETNADRRFDRNRARIEIMPRLRELNPRVVEALGRAAHLAALDEAVLDTLVDDAFERARVPSPSGLALDAACLLELAPALGLRVVRRAVAEVAGGLRRLELRHAEGLLDLAGRPTGRALTLPGGVVARSERDRIVLRPPEKPLSESVPLPLPGAAGWSGGRVVSRRLEGDEVPADPSRASTPRRALLNADVLAEPLMVRPWRRGDRFRPLGGPGERLVADFLRDAGVAAPDRGRLPLVVAGERIAWIGGHRIDERFRLRPGARTAVELVWEAP